MARTNEMHLNAIPLKVFSFHKPTGHLVAEDSTVSANTPQPIEGQIWNDACDVGIAILSHHTGKEERFYHSHDVRDRDGDLQVRVYKPCNAKCRVTEVHILND